MLERQIFYHHAARAFGASKQDVFLGKLDYQLNQTNHLSAVFNFQDWKEPFGYTAPSLMVNNGGASQNEMGEPTSASSSPTGPQISPATGSTEVRFQWGRDFEFDSTNSGGPAASLLNIASYGEILRSSAPGVPG